jgi:hypothetical protein
VKFTTRRDSTSYSYMNSFVLIALFFALLVSFDIGALAGRAPDEAPDLPAGWCNTKFGSPTRSTGECICKRYCSGKGCHREHGLEFYKYSECPKCECVGEPPDGIEGVNPARTEQPQPQTIQNEESEQVEEEDESFDLVDWIDGNSKELFAGTVSLVVFGFVILFLMQ